MDNQPGKPGNQVKIKRKGVNPYGDIVTSNKTFENILKKFDEKKTNKQNAEVELETTEEVILNSSIQTFQIHMMMRKNKY